MSVQSSRPTGVTKTDCTRTPKEAWLIVALLLLFMLINFADKAVIGIAAVPIMQELQLSPRQFGLLGSSFYLPFATNWVREVSHPSVIATFRLAIAEAARSPEIAQALDSAGRDAVRRALAELLASAQSTGLTGPGEPAEMAMQFLGLVWEGLMIGLLLGVAAPPEPAEAERRAAKATAAFMQLHPDPASTG